MLTKVTLLVRPVYPWADENDADMPFENDSIFVPFYGGGCKEHSISNCTKMEQKQDQFRHRKSPQNV
jgi:hypothetical protein